MDYELIDNLTYLRSTLTHEARRCTHDPAYCDFLYHEWQRVTARIEREWRRSEGSGVVPRHMRHAHEGTEQRAAA